MAKKDKKNAINVVYMNCKKKNGLLMSLIFQDSLVSPLLKQLETHLR